MDAHPDDLAQLGDSILGWLDLSRCPRCDRITTMGRYGHPTLCLHCTETEIGIPAADNAARIAAGMSLRQWLARPPDDPYPPPRASSLRRRIFGVGWLGG